MARDSIDTRRMDDESIARALAHHKQLGAVRDWARLPVGWRVDLAGTGPLHWVEARTKREIGILLAGLTSAGELREGDR